MSIRRKELEAHPAEGRYTKPLPIKAIAGMFGVHRNTMSKWLRIGVVKGKRAGGLWRVLYEELPAELPPNVQQTA